MVLQPSYIDVAQVLEGNVNQSVGSTSLKESSPKIHNIEITECEGRNKPATEKAKSTLEGGSGVNSWRTPEINQAQKSDYHIVGNKFYSLVNEESHHSKLEEFRQLAKQDSATEECSSLLSRMELEVSDEDRKLSTVRMKVWKRLMR